MGEADALRVLSTVARLRGKADVALASARRAVEIATKVEDPWRRAEAQRELGTVYESIGRTRDAAATFRASADAFQLLGADGRATQMRERAAGGGTP
jgi:hypothetical protein